MTTQILERYDIVNNKNIQSLVKAEWDTVRAGQAQINPIWKLQNRRFSKECCGLLFHKGSVLASNGHWIMKCRTSDYFYFAGEVNSLFYYYDDNSDDQIIENLIPYENLNVHTDQLFGEFKHWGKYNIKIRIDSLMEVINRHVPTVRDQRTFMISMSQQGKTMHIELKGKHGEHIKDSVLLHSYNTEDTPTISLNLSYVCKILSIIHDWYYLVDLSLCEDGNVRIKAKNPFQNKPDFRFILGQYKI